jgi:hypothetical protein
MVVIVDEIDSDVLFGRRWWWHGRYVKGEGTYLHRAILEKQFGPIPKGMVTDHIDGNALNNRRGNLRICLQSENVRNSKPRKGSKSRFKGIFRQASGGWASQITVGGKKVCLGTYDTEEDAAKAYDGYAKSLVDEYRRLNFSPPPDGRRGYCGLAGKP